MTSPPTSARPPRQSGARVVAVVVVLSVLAVLGLGGLLAGLRDSDRDDGRQSRGDGLVPAGVDRGTPATQGAPLAADVDLTMWTADTSARTAVPARAVHAYGAAEIAQRDATPECRLSWTTLAGVGRVESDHGRLGRAGLDADGVSRPLIVGVPLDGTDGVREIRDTDGGALDGDTTYDRAVGPLQFLPTTWARYGTDGNGDGTLDPHQIDDAARAAAAYLCAEGRDTADGEGWWDGVLAYNESVGYARLVWAAVDRYATVTSVP